MGTPGNDLFKALEVKIIALFIILCMGSLCWAQNKIDANTMCFASSVIRDKYDRPIYLFIRTYFDNALGIEVGAIAKYRSSKSYIPLVFLDKREADIESPALGNFIVRRLELAGGKSTGEYDLIKTGAGTRQGTYLEYISYKDKRKVVFSPQDDLGDCL